MFIYLITTFLFSLNFPSSEIAVPAEYYNIQNWNTTPLIFDYYYKGDKLGDERINVSFPSPPAKSGAIYTAKDNEGTEFSLSALQVPDSEFELSSAVERLAYAITSSENKKLLLKNESTLVWIKDNEINHLTLIQSGYFIYFLNTTDKQSQAAKAAAFANSFSVTDGFSFS